jgi:hypothetical protein
MKRTVTLLVVALIAVTSVLAAAQAIGAQKVDPPMILSGPDVGFRVEAWRGSTALGQLLVRIDGKWVEADFAGGPRRISN